MAFIETPRFPIELVVGSSGGPEFNTNVVPRGRNVPREVRIPRWSYPRNRYNGAIGIRNVDDYNVYLNWFNTVKGRFAGFRLKDEADFKSTNPNDTVAFNDQPLGTGDGTTTAFQLVKRYSQGAQITNKPVLKPVADTTRIGIDGVELGSDTSPIGWSVNTTTGIVTFDNLASNITAISQAANAQVTTAASHGLSVGHTVYISGVIGMVEINDARYTVVSVINTTNFTLNVDSTTFTAYTSDGTTNTLPQTAETLTSGYEFDVPVRFDTDSLSNAVFDGAQAVSVNDIPIIEIFDTT